MQYLYTNNLFSSESKVTKYDAELDNPMLFKMD